RITAIDRSKKMIEMAARRNREHVAGGRAVLKTAALEKADFGDERFDKIFAFNVAPFWRQPKEALGIVRRHLAPDGAPAKRTKCNSDGAWQIGPWRLVPTTLRKGPQRGSR
ncbi:MAG TPA: class I SAM-dependent methyltransferase, partial [Burkholderiales bacterium]|nr:class I SAM-dependent methyltransferase [Burkholderiales bacterium]